MPDIRESDRPVEKEAIKVSSNNGASEEATDSSNVRISREIETKRIQEQAGRLLLPLEIAEQPPSGDHSHDGGLGPQGGPLKAGKFDRPLEPVVRPGTGMVAEITKLPDGKPEQRIADPNHAVGGARPWSVERDSHRGSVELNDRSDAHHAKDGKAHEVPDTTRDSKNSLVEKGDHSKGPLTTSDGSLVFKDDHGITIKQKDGKTVNIEHDQSVRVFSPDNKLIEMIDAGRREGTVACAGKERSTRLMEVA